MFGIVAHSEQLGEHRIDRFDSRDEFVAETPDDSSGFAGVARVAKCNLKARQNRDTGVPIDIDLEVGVMGDHLLHAFGEGFHRVGDVHFFSGFGIGLSGPDSTRPPQCPQM
jgi:hypothetical protein